MRRNILFIIGFVILALLVGSGAWFYSNYVRPQIIRSRLQEVRGLTAAAKYQEAFAILEQLAHEYPGKRVNSDDPRLKKIQAETDAAIGADALAHHQIALAVQNFEAARSLSPTVSVAADLGLAYALGDNFTKALETLNAGIQQTPQNARLYLVRALVYGQLMDLDHARQDATRVLQLDPSLGRFLPQSIVPRASSG